MKLVTKEISYQLDGQNYIGYFAAPVGTEKKPAILLFPDWTGRNKTVCERAEYFASLGYVAFAADMYGNAKVGNSVEENKAMMMPLMQDRMQLQKRVHAALNTIKEMTDVDNHKIAALGFCFGGLCALDLARSGADVKGVVSLHGLFNPIDNYTPRIKAKVLILHGYNDPMAKPEQIVDFAAEMDAAQVDWQVHFYGNTQHAFTNPHANNPEMGTVYSELATKRAFLTCQNFLAEIL